MIELQGKNTDIKIMIDNVEPDVITQTLAMARTDACTYPIRVMPDTHVGVEAVIGFTEQVNGKIRPSTIGVDIGCGMLAQQFDMKCGGIDYSIIDAEIRDRIPLGFSIHVNKHVLPNSIFAHAQSELETFTASLNSLIDASYEPILYSGYDHITYFEDLCKKIGTTTTQVINSCGTLGGGNHFIEIDKDRQDNVWSVVHSGSRNLGLKIANYHQKKAGKEFGSYLDGEDAYEYFVDMIFAQQFASASRRMMSDILADILDVKVVNMIESIHNYIDPLDGMIRKGAIRSYEEELMVIPFNMRDGTIICEGKSNPDWNYSAPHGAGRVMSRGVAKRTLKIEKYEADMVDVWSSSVNASTIDEAPDCYKNFEIIMEAIEPTATIKNILKPVYNIKG